MTNTKTIRIQDLTDEQQMILTGTNDRNLAAMGDVLQVSVSYRDSSLFLENCDEITVQKVESVIHTLTKAIVQGRNISEQDVIYACRLTEKNQEIDYEELSSCLIGRTLSGKPVCPKTKGQLAFARAMERAPIVFAIGPAGTGKTYLAVIAAVSALKRGDVRRIVLTRPAVEAGENLGFLPGDLKEKVDPYLTPLYDALHAMLGNEKTEALMEKGTIEIAPLAYMRGRTLDDAYVILDEAQNTTTSQMKMFLTRLGFHSRMIVTGDITQIDLKSSRDSGLIQAQRILKGIDDIEIIHLSADDVVRHPLVQKIIERYEMDAQKNMERREG
ncbi:MAG: PhoH family protein [Bulleidia sp.]